MWTASQQREPSGMQAASRVEEAISWVGTDGRQPGAWPQRHPCAKRTQEQPVGSASTRRTGWRAAKNRRQTEQKIERGPT